MRISWMFLSSFLLAACAASTPAATSADDADTVTTDTATSETAGTDASGQDTSACAAVHIITARASAEAAGEGRTKALIDQIVSTSTQTVTRAAVVYPATLTNYAGSSAAGVTALKTQLTAQVQSCPTQKIVLAGYSQGAHVILDVLGGGGGSTLGALTDPIDASIASHVVVAVSFGDPRHVINQSFDQGTSQHNGMFPRTDAQLQVLGGYAARIQAYCDTDDKYCDSGTSISIHTSYLSRYQDAAAAFVLGKIGG